MSETQQPYEPQGQRPANHWSSTEPTSSRPAWLLPVLVLGALVVLAGGVMVAIVGWLLLGGDDEPQPEAVGDEQEAEAQDDEAEGEPADQSPHAAAEGYLQALTAGDLPAAEDHLSGSFGDFTQEMLDRSLEIAPLEGLEIAEAPSEDSYADEYSVPVDYTWTVGGEQHSGSIDTVQDFQSETWEVDDIYALTAVTLPQSGGDLEYTVNGEGGHGDRAELVAGLAYEVDVDHENFELAAEQSNDEGWFVLEADDWVTFSSTDLALTEEAEEMWRDLIIADVDECLDSGEAAPGCGLDIVYDNVDIEEGSVQRSMSTSSRQSLESIEPEIDYNNPNLVGTWISGVTVDTLFEGTVDGERSIYEVTIGPELRLDDPIVDMTDESPEVTWEGYGASWDPDSGEEAPDDEPDEESEFLPTGMLQ